MNITQEQLKKTEHVVALGDLVRALSDNTIYVVTAVADDTAYLNEWDSNVQSEAPVDQCEIVRRGKPLNGKLPGYATQCPQCQERLSVPFAMSERTLCCPCEREVLLDLTWRTDLTFAPDDFPRRHAVLNNKEPAP